MTQLWLLSNVYPISTSQSPSASPTSASSPAIVADSASPSTLKSPNSCGSSGLQIVPSAVSSTFATVRSPSLLVLAPVLSAAILIDRSAG